MAIENYYFYIGIIVLCYCTLTWAHASQSYMGWKRIQEKTYSGLQSNRQKSQRSSLPCFILQCNVFW